MIDDVVCFTDSSWINDQFGASIFNSSDKEELFYPLGKLCSVFQLEYCYVCISQNVQDKGNYCKD